MCPTYDPTDLESLPVGTRVELHPGTDLWMSGDRFGVVVGIGRPRRGIAANSVRLDRSGRTRTLTVDRLTAVD